MARPSVDDKKILDALEKIADGISVRAACGESGIGLSTFFREVCKDTFRDHYAKAMEIRAATMFSDMLDIADNDAPDVQRDRLRVDARKWALSKMMPKKYGEKVEMTHEGGDAPIKLQIEYC